MPLSTLVDSNITAAPIVINHQGLFPATTISFNLKPGVALGDAVDAIRKIEQQSGKPQSLVTTFQGNANAFLSSLAGEPLLIAAALVTIYIIIGIVKKNGILMVDFALQLERNEGRSREDAIYQACVLRFRPILMTTMAALLGAVPLMLGTGAGSEIRQPLGYAIVGGLLLSQLLTLFTTPVVYLYLDRLGGFLRHKRVAILDSRSSSTSRV